MKKLIYTLCLFTGMAISSCEDWLARDPLDQIADVNLTYTADECKLYVNQFYTSFWGSPNNYIYHIDRGSDNLLSDNYQDNKDLIEGLHQIPSSGEGWGTTEWGKIRSVNFLLDNCDKSPEPEKPANTLVKLTSLELCSTMNSFCGSLAVLPGLIKHWILNQENCTALA